MTTTTEIIADHLIGEWVRVEFADGGEPEYGTLTFVGEATIEVEHGVEWQRWTGAYTLTGDGDTAAVVSVTACGPQTESLF